MKKQVCIGLSTLLILGMCSGCGKTQTAAATTVPKETIVQKQVSDTIPDRFTGEWTGVGDTVTVRANAPVELPDLSKLCTATLERRQFPQEEADKMLEVFLQGNPLYKKVYDTKQDLQAELNQYEAMLRGEIPFPEFGDGDPSHIYDLIEECKNEMERAPNQGEKPLADTQFHVEKGWDPNYEYADTEIQGYAEVDGTKIDAWITNSESRFSTAEFIREDYGTFGGPFVVKDEYWSEKQGQIDFEIKPSFGVDKAKEMGDAIIRELGLDTFTLNHVDPTAFSKIDENFGEKPCVMQNSDGTYSLLPNTETGYILIYVRTVNELPLIRTSFRGRAYDESAPAPGIFPYEYIKIIVNQDGMVYFKWEGPYTEPQIQSTDLDLLPFAQIQDIFSQKIFEKNDIHNMKISEVKLNLMRVRDAHTLGPAKIVPVWDFYGTDEEARENKGSNISYTSYEIKLTIDAINGNVYDRELGY